MNLLFKLRTLFHLSEGYSSLKCSIDPTFQNASNANCDFKVDEEPSDSDMAEVYLVNGNDQCLNVSKPEQSVSVTPNI
jgi:hypothetical protein